MRFVAQCFVIPLFLLTQAAWAVVEIGDGDLAGQTFTYTLTHTTLSNGWQSATVGAFSLQDRTQFRELSGDAEPRMITPWTPGGNRTNYAEFVIGFNFSSVTDLRATNVVLSDKLFLGAFTNDPDGNPIPSQTLTIYYRENDVGPWTLLRSLTSDGVIATESNVTYAVPLNRPEVFQYRVTYTVEDAPTILFAGDGQVLRWGFVRNTDADLTAFSAQFDLAEEDVGNAFVYEILHADLEAKWTATRQSWMNTQFRQLDSAPEPRFIQPSTPSGARTNYAAFILGYDLTALAGGTPTNVIVMDRLYLAAFTTDPDGANISNQTITVYGRENNTGPWTELRDLSSDGSGIQSSTLTYDVPLNNPTTFQYRVIYTVDGDPGVNFAGDGQGLRWSFRRNDDVDLTAFKLIFQFADEDIVVSGFSVTPGGVASVTFTSVNGVDYVLQHTTDLAGDPPAWLDATGPDAAKTGDGNALTLEDADPADPVRAYRLVTP